MSIVIRSLLALALIAAAALLLPHEGQAGHVVSGAAPAEGGPRLVLPIMNPQRGKTLFVSKGCVACHAINGVGGHDAPNLDAHTMKHLMNPFDFVAKMWNHAPGMIMAQQMALGEQVTFTGHEIADIIAFVHSDEVQHAFTEDDLTPRARRLMEHEHGPKGGPAAHAEELGNHHGPGEGH